MDSLLLVLCPLGIQGPDMLETTFPFKYLRAP